MGQPDLVHGSAHEWASRSLQREFERVITVAVLIEQMDGSD